MDLMSRESTQGILPGRVSGSSELPCGREKIFFAEQSFLTVDISS